MRRITIALALGLLAAFVPSVHAASARPGILYSVDAKGPTVVQSGGGLRLTLPANATVTWFTDRPSRLSGRTNMQGLVDRWDASSFSQDPPNAALVLTDRGVERTHVVKLLRPRHANGRVSFAIRALPAVTEAGYVQTHELVTGRYGLATLFIDDAAYPPCPSMITSVLTCIGTSGQDIAVSTAASALPLAVRACASPTAAGAAVYFDYLDIFAAVPTTCPTPTTVVMGVVDDLLAIATQPGVTITLFVVPAVGSPSSSAPGSRPSSAPGRRPG